jgi:hypothetical protein
MGKVRRALSVLLFSVSKFFFKVSKWFERRACLVGSAPNFSLEGQKRSYEKMQKWIAHLRENFPTFGETGGGGGSDDDHNG